LIFTTLVLIFGSALPADTPRTAPAPAAVEVNASGDAPKRDVSNNPKPDTPAPKTAVVNEEAEGSGGGASSSSALPIANVPVQPASTESYETPRQRMIWYGLIAAGHAGAGFDAWTTRRAIGGGYGTEADPTQRPFAHSNAIYATTQVSPLIMDYVGHRMMRSRYSMMRRFWWVPQSACASLSFGSAIHNYRVVH
jgi:hypothetical protein